MLQASLQRGPGPRVQRCGMRAAAECDGAPFGVDVGVAEVLEFTGGGAVEKGEQPDERLVRVDVGVGAPAVEQVLLSFGGQCRSSETPGLWGVQTAGRVDEHPPSAGRETAELAQPGQVEGAPSGSGVQERLDVADLDGGPVRFAMVLSEEPGQVAYRGESSVQGGMLVWVGAGSACPVPPGHQMLGEGDHRGPQRLWHCVDSALPTPGGMPFFPVCRQGQPPEGEEILQGAGQGDISGAAFEQQLRVHRSFVGEESTEPAE